MAVKQKLNHLRLCIVLPLERIERNSVVLGRTSALSEPCPSPPDPARELNPTESAFARWFSAENTSVTVPTSSTFLSFADPKRTCSCQRARLPRFWMSAHARHQARKFDRVSVGGADRTATATGKIVDRGDATFVVQFGHEIKFSA